MKLYEFEPESVDATILTGVVGQYQNRSEDTGYKNRINLDVVLNALNERGLNVDKELFLKMIKNPPLSNIVANVDGDNIVFKGADDVESEPDGEKQADLVDKMAKSTLKK
jgi:hypothetical protein